eukprot:6208173-Pleurochrysis_carterae.AAC.2
MAHTKLAVSAVVHNGVSHAPITLTRRSRSSPFPFVNACVEPQRRWFRAGAARGQVVARLRARAAVSTQTRALAREASVHVSRTEGDGAQS